jgi:hypothetical protein
MLDRYGCCRSRSRVKGRVATASVDFERVHRAWRSLPFFAVVVIQIGRKGLSLQ